MLKQPIAIQSIGSISSLGNCSNSVLSSYQKGTHCFSYQQDRWQGKIINDSALTPFQEHKLLKNVDRSVLLGVYAADYAFKNTQWDNTQPIAINFGSSRGATGLWESNYNTFLKSRKVAALTSPLTTSGNISSSIGQYLELKGFHFSHSITCSTAMHSILNGIAWLQSGIVHRFIVGGTEAPLTSFTFAQLDALGIYSKATKNEAYPNQSLNLKKENNTLVLGEGATAIALDLNLETAIAQIKGFGIGSESIRHLVSIDIVALKESMTNVIERLGEPIDVIITHTPGTVKGDLAELEAIQHVFGSEIPEITSNKWILGHTFGASGALSLEMAILMLQKQTLFKPSYLGGNKPKKIKNILINTIGFGGNAVSLVVGL